MDHIAQETIPERDLVDGETITITVEAPGKDTKDGYFVQPVVTVSDLKNLKRITREIRSWIKRMEA